MSHPPNAAKRLARPTQLPIVIWAVCCCIAGVFSSNDSVQAFPQNPDFIRVRVKPGHTPEFPRVIKGRVTDTAGKPISGALISWGQLYHSDAQKETVTTGDDGAYEIETNNVGVEYGVSILAKGFCPKLEYIPSPGPKSLPLEKDFQLDEDREIEISVVDERGLPLTGFEVKPLMQKKSGQVAFGLSGHEVVIPGHESAVPVDDAGQCRLKGLVPAPGGLSDIFVSWDELRPEHAAPNRPNDECWLILQLSTSGTLVMEHHISRTTYARSLGRFRVVIPSRGPLAARVSSTPIYGQVLDTDAQPVRKYRVSVSYQNGSIEFDNPEGRFTFGSESQPAKECLVRIVADGFAPASVAVDPDETDYENPWVITLNRTVQTSFLLIDQQSHEPIVNAQIKTGTISEEFNQRPKWQSFESTFNEDQHLDSVLLLNSDSKGRFSFPELPNSSTLIIRTPGYPRTIITPDQRPKPGEDGMTRISLNFGGVVEGVSSGGFDNVTLYKKSTDGMRYIANAQSIDVEGLFRFDSLATGEYELIQRTAKAHLPARSCIIPIKAVAGETVTIKSNYQTGSLKLTGRTRPFSGVTIERVSSPDSVTVGGAAATDVLETIEAKADVDGYFELDSLNPGVYQFTNESFRYFNHYPMGLISLKTPSEFHLNEDTHIDVVEGVISPPNAAVMPANPL